ncbi:MAG: hypothetical protein CSA70_05240 [Rhodobacterales bacterium]|nr:MAG: hypothetical protein CSA70_05240 [Rhodobacterales bacterium]
MFKTIAASAVLAAASLTPMTAAAGGIKTPLKAPDSMVHLTQATRAPQASNLSTSRWYTNASGCEYSRAGRPGEVVWFLTSIPRGASCPEFIVEKKIDNAYRAPHMIDG